MKFRKRPIVVEAFQWLPGTVQEWPTWFHASGGYWTLTNNRLFIRTKAGSMEASPGDWIIKGIAGELYPCKPDIFAATYEPVKP